MPRIVPRTLIRIVAAGILLFVPCAGTLTAQGKPAIGSRDIAVADPALPTPRITPCTVQLFPRQPFGEKGNENGMTAVPHTFTYQPPAGCKGPWARVVLKADFSVPPGHQYDRTASIWLDGVNIYFGTTQEPFPNLGQSWRIERDLTDYSSLLRSPGSGAALINNWVNSWCNSPVYAGARLFFYPADSRYPAPQTPDKVYPLNPSDAPVNLQTANDRLTLKARFPHNTGRVYLDVLPESQFDDEYWYNCLPDKYFHGRAAKVSDACGGGAYREVEVEVDGQPAGLAPIFPWVFTGHVDPLLWHPTPAIQTLNFQPSRIDLTPFAGPLSDGAEHSVAVRILGSHHYFSVAAALLVYRDPKAGHTGGAITRNTLKGLSLEPTVTSTLDDDPTELNGEVVTRAKQSYEIEGYINTPAGRVNSRVERSLTFANTQKLATLSDKSRRHLSEQSGQVSTTSSRTGGRSAGSTVASAFNYSLMTDVLEHSNPDRSTTHTVRFQQTYDKRVEQRQAGLPPYESSLRNTDTAADQMKFPFHGGHFQVYDSRGLTSTQTFDFTNSLGDCYRAELKALGGKVSSFTQGCGTKPPHWFVHPDGSPDSFGWRRPVHR